MKLTLGSRGSRLALVQTRAVAAAIQAIHPDWEIDMQVITTTGDRNRREAIGQIGGKEIFVKEIEEALLEGTIDLAVHSMKDLPAILPPGLRLAYAPPREDPRDILVFRQVEAWDQLPAHARIGTGSGRRACQLKALLPEAEIVMIRGNIETRIQKLETENLDAVVLAAAALHRLDLQPGHVQLLPVETMIPSPAQGILGVEMRAEDGDLYRALRPLNDPVAEEQGRLERQYLLAVGGSCTLPVGAYAEIAGENVHLRALLGHEGADQAVRGELTGQVGQDLGQALADQLMTRLGSSEEKA